MHQIVIASEEQCNEPGSCLLCSAENFALINHNKLFQVANASDSRSQRVSASSTETASPTSGSSAQA